MEKSEHFLGPSEWCWKPEMSRAMDTPTRGRLLQGRRRVGTSSQEEKETLRHRTVLKQKQLKFHHTAPMK